MKKINLLLFTIMSFITSCDTNNSKQKLSFESISGDTTLIDSLKIKKKSSDINDTIIYANIEEVFNTPWIENPKKYFRQNNLYKDWDQKNRKEVIISYFTLKDGNNINVRVRKSSGNKKLDDEAIRLIQKMKYQEPAIDYKHNPINVKDMAICVYFPPK